MPNKTEDCLVGDFALLFPRLGLLMPVIAPGSTAKIDYYLEFGNTQPRLTLNRAVWGPAIGEPAVSGTSSVVDTG